LPYVAPLQNSDWVVYAKAPFGGPDRVLDYLGRYTHRVAISNHRLKELKDGKVTFAYKDYKHEQRQKLMTVSADEFLRRFLLHVLPDSFQRIRHYGLLGNRHRAEHLARCRELLAMLPPIPQTDSQIPGPLPATHGHRSAPVPQMPSWHDGAHRRPPHC
jgi:hypothetical protein